MQCSSECFPTRHMMALLLFLCTSLAYIVKTNINITIVTMVNSTRTENDTMIEDDDKCKATSNATDHSINMDAETFAWDASVQSVVLGSFFYGYICTQVLGGYLSERIGPKWLLGLSTLAGSLLTLLTPVVASWNVTALIVLRVITGMTQGFIFPSCVHCLSLWIPNKERSVVTMFVMAGCQIGTMVSMEVGGYLCKYGFAGGWPSVYYVFGILSAVWFVFWTALSSSTPEQHPRICDQEKDYIRQGIFKSDKRPVPWKSLLTSLPVLAFVIGHTTSQWTSYIVLTELPTYIDHVLHSPIDQNGSINALVYVIGTVTSIAAGWLADWLISRGHSKPTFTRKIIQNIGHYGSVASLLCLPLVKCDHTLVITLLASAKAFSCITPVSDINIVADMAPAFSGTIFGMGNSFAALMGALAPTITGVFLKNGMGRLSSWRWIFTITAALEVFGAIFFLLFADAEKQPWAVLAEDRESSAENQTNEERAVLSKNDLLENNVQ